MEMQALGLGWSRARLQHPPAEQQELLQPCLLPALGLPPPDPGLEPQELRRSGSSHGRSNERQVLCDCSSPCPPCTEPETPSARQLPQHMVNTLLIIMAVNSTSLLPEPLAGTGTRPLPARLALGGTDTPKAALLPCPLPGVSPSFRPAQPSQDTCAAPSHCTPAPAQLRHCLG